MKVEQRDLGLGGFGELQREINRDTGGPGPALRALRTQRTSTFEREPPETIMGEFRNALALYFGGDMEASIALSGQVAGRIDAVKPVARVIAETASRSG